MALRLSDLKQKRAELVGAANKIATEAEKRGAFNDDERAAFDSKMAEADGLAPDILRFEKLAHYESVSKAADHRGNPLPHEVEKRHDYSVLKAIRQSWEARTGKGKLDGLELEVHQEMEIRRAEDQMTKAQGVLIPFDLPTAMPGFDRRALDTTAGTGTIPTILAGTMIDLLRTRMVLAGMGATFLTGMQGLFAIPRQSGAATGAWAAEGVAPAASNQTADQVTFSPKTVGTYTDYTRRFMEQTNQNAEMFVRNDLTKVIGRGLENGAFNGTGLSNQPLGIFKNTTIQTASAAIQGGAAGAALAWSQAIGLETIVANNNADMGRLSYLTNSATRGKLKQTAKIGSTFPFYIWDTNSPATPINGYPAWVTNLVPSNLVKGGSGAVCSAIAFGNWEDLVIAMWSGIDLLVDPYTGGNAGTIRVNALLDADINERHTESFAIITDVLTA